MPSLLGRARRARRHHNTDTFAADLAAKHNPAIDPTASVAGATHSDLTAADPAALTPQLVPASGSPTPRTRIVRTRISGAWVAVIVAVVGLVFLLIFILQNLTRATVYFLGATGALPMGVALLFAAVAGALLIALFGSARILQLRRVAHRRRH